jgi:polyketide synthase 13
MMKENIINWLKSKVAEEAGIPEQEVSETATFESFQLDSLSLVSLSYELEQLTGKTMEPTVFWEYNTIDKLSDWVSINEN